MNFVTKIGCRIYQKTMFVASFFLQWREPQLLQFSNGISDLPSYIKQLGVDNILVVIGPNIHKLGIANTLFDSLSEQKIRYAIFDKVQSNPTTHNVEQGVLVYNQHKCQAIIAFGGGSPMDCAKAIGARIARPNKSINQLKGLLKVIKPIPTLFAIPTTAGSGSEATLASVITDQNTNEKFAINDTRLIPHYAILDPRLTTSLSPNITATTGMDTLTHAIEAYIGNSNTKSTKSHAKKAIKLIFDNLIKAYDNGGDIQARVNMQQASYYAGVAFTRAYVGNVHAIAHQLGGFYNIPHGYANAIILPYVLEFYGQSVYNSLSQIADLVSIGKEQDSPKEKSQKLIQAIKDMNKYMSIPDKIQGIKQEDIAIMSKRASKEANPLYPVPRIMSKADFEYIYNQISE